MQILIPISGHSAFFPKEEFYFPKPLVEIAGRPMIELVVRQLRQQFKEAVFIFVVDRADILSFSLDRILSLLAGPRSFIIEKPGQTSGALSSCLLAVDVLMHNEPLIIVNSDQIIEDDLSPLVDSFVNDSAAAGVITFESVHPRWSYILSDNAGNVLQAFEKKVASRDAIAGFYYFESAALFLESAKRVILNDVHIDDAYFVSSTLNEILLANGSVRHHPISASAYHSFYAPTKIDEFERTNYASSLRSGSPSMDIVNVIIPAAGEGSRFKLAGWKKPKPFIDVDGRDMLNHVIDNVTPEGGRVSVLLRKEHIDSNVTSTHKIRQLGCEIIPVSQLTEGTACTVLLARHSFDNSQPLLIANSDQFVEFDVNAFIKDCLSRGLDGSILVFRDPTMDPKWSFVKLDSSGLVIEVAEKNAISDLATVGIYFFTKGRDFTAAALDMIVANDRVNNEFYTCPVYNYMIKNGLRIGVYEVPKQAMAGLGTPEDLNKYLELNNAPPSCHRPT